MSRSTTPGLLKSYHSAVTAVQRLADAGWIVLAHAVAVRLYPQPWTEANTTAVATGVLAFHLLAETNGLYRSWRTAKFRQECTHVLATWAIVIPVLLGIAFLTKSTAYYSRFISVVWFALTPVLLIVWRLAVRTVLMEMRRRGRNSRTVAIAGVTRVGERLAQSIITDPYAGMKLKGFYDDRSPDRRHELAKGAGEFVGDLDLLVEDAKAGRLDYVYITLPLRAEPRINNIVRRLADTTATVSVVADFLVFDLLHAQWDSVGDIPVVSIFDTPFHGVGGWLKRVEDIVIGSLILVLIALPMLAIAIGIKVTSPGPVFFKQRRYGLNGKEIHVLKFRSMNVCEDGPVVRQATRNDARVTPFGAFLRQTSLDELPQFLQVLTGEMSIVGPRPHAVAHNELYRQQIHGYMLRHKVKPGITGWAQVNGWRGETDTVAKMERRVEHDLEYIHNWDLFWDLKIILLTVFGSKKNQNAY
jgi:putative colanic acid biosysnthesis UDP-glucose lipid carrier transferase